jgi:hypothetical protein
MKKIMIVLLLVGSSVFASDWAGHNGTIVLSFGQEQGRVHTVESIEGVGVLVDVYATFTGISELFYNQTKVMTCGGFELQLKIDGAEGKILVQNLPKQSRINIGKSDGQCIVGVNPDLSIMKDVQLVHWQIMLPEGANNVRFSLDPEGLFSAKGLEGCLESNPVALWAGGKDANHLGLIFAASCAPAYLNWDGEPELEIIRGTVDSIETGLFTSGD